MARSRYSGNRHPSPLSLPTPLSRPFELRQQQRSTRQNPPQSHTHPLQSYLITPLLPGKSKPFYRKGRKGTQRKSNQLQHGASCIFTLRTFAPFAVQSYI
jgi:hypothetical protein